MNGYAPEYVLSPLSVEKLRNSTEEEHEKIIQEEKRNQEKLHSELKEHYRQRLTSAKERLELLINQIADKERNIEIESLANQIKNWKEHEFAKEEKERNDKIIDDNWKLARANFLKSLNTTDDNIAQSLKEAEGLQYKETLPQQYPWEHVALSMLRFPDSVVLDYDKCPDCGHTRIRVFFYSPEWTWANMCGVGGDIVICPNCKVQAEFTDTIRS